MRKKVSGRPAGGLGRAGQCSRDRMGRVDRQPSPLTVALPLLAWQSRLKVLISSKQARNGAPPGMRLALRRQAMGAFVL